jgi:hypothetical protein
LPKLSYFTRPALKMNAFTGLLFCQEHDLSHTLAAIKNEFRKMYTARANDVKTKPSKVVGVQA